jgi:protein-S-isoprenylcysteine O-methyltransferase Ste14
MPTFLDNRIPPPLIALLTGTGIRYAARTVLSPYSLPALLTGQYAQYAQYLEYTPYAAGAIAVASVSLLAAATIQFRKYKTTVTPLSPGKATSLVADGVFAHTRNPMYVGLAGVLAAFGVYVQNPLAGAIGVATFVTYITQFQIKPEEKALSALFGEAYTAYRAKVSRWI